MKNSTTFEEVAAALEGHHHASELIATLKTWNAEASEFYENEAGEQLNGDLAEAVYWIAYIYHGGQSCPLYAAGSASGFSPGMAADNVEPGTEAELIYKDLETILESEAS